MSPQNQSLRNQKPEKREPSGEAPGRVLTMPRRRSRRRRGLLTAGAVVVVLAVLMALLYFSPLMAVKTVTVEGTRIADAKALDRQLTPLKGVPMPQVSSDRVRELLKGQPAIEDIRLKIASPTELTVHVLEYREVAVLRTDKGDYLVGDNGARLRKVAGGEKRRLPLVKIDGPDPEHRVFDAVVASLAQLPPEVLRDMDSAQAKTVDSVTFTLRDHRKVVWGGPADGATKAAILEAFLGDKGVKDKVLDVSTPTRPVTHN